MFTEEKKKLLALEEKMRLKVSKQWSHLHSSIKQPFLVHPMYWGHKTRSLRRPRQHAGSTPPLYSQQVHPQPSQQLPHHSQQVSHQPVHHDPGVVQKEDEYSNRSRILTFDGDGDWQVGRSEDEETSSDISSLDIGVSREIIAEVHAHDDDPIDQGSTDSPATGIQGIVYGDDVTPMCPSVEDDEDIFPDVREAMTAHPPPFYSIMDAREAVAAQGNDLTGDEGLAQLLSQVEYSDDVEETYSEFENDEPRDDDLQSDANVQTTGYLSEFQAFYANYEEGADHLYYREEDGDDDDEDDFEEDED